MFRSFSLWLHLLLPHVGTVVGFALAIILVARIGIDKRPVPNTWAWVLAVVVVPWVGVPLYLAFGGRKLRKRAAEKTLLYLSSREEHQTTPVERILAAAGIPPARDANRCELLTDGQVAFERTIEVIGAARRTLDLATFILANDRTGDAVLDALTESARRKVRVRVLIDALFAFRVNRRGLARLRAAGGQVAFFMPLLLRRPFRGHANLRNHRKLLVVDGDLAILGGMNLAEEYMGPTPLPNRWRDVGLVVRGPTVADVTDVFANDWSFATSRQSPTPIRERATETSQTAIAPAGRVQAVASGPDATGDPLYEALVTAVFDAQHRLAIATPYFVPDDTLLKALFLALRRGVEVTIVVPRASNHRLADLAGVSVLRDLEEAGARVRPYVPAMLHAKVVLVDDRLAFVGSANFDMRSLFLDFELALLCTSAQEIAAIDRWFAETLTTCAARLDPSPRPRPLREGLARLLAPLI